MKLFPSFTNGILAGVITACCAFQANAAADDTLSAARDMQLAIVKGSAIEKVLGQSSDDYSVMVFNGTELAPIPFQFDDLNDKGFPYVPGGSLAIEGQEGIIEAQDELVFMIRDSGSKAEADALAAVEGEVVLELELKDLNIQRYAYLVKGNASRSDVHYTHYNQETGFIKTDHFTLETDPDNIFVWADLMYEGYEPQKSIWDTMKIRIHARMGFLKTTLSNRFIPSEVVAVKNGAVRTIISVDATIALFGVELASAGANVTVTSQTLQFPVHITVPKAANILSDFNIDISLDFHEMDGVQIRSGAGSKEPLVAGKDGIGAGAEPKDLALSVEESWLTGTTQQGWDIIAFFVGSKNFAPDLDVLYFDHGRDSEEDSPERYDGSYPQVGYIVNELPVGEAIVIGIDLYFDDGFWADGNLETSVKELQNPIAVIAHTPDGIASTGLASNGLASSVSE
ncbi:MAG: hypothetical protein COB51_02815 [Moraxellaceae bacterium]|nr:MAG: hypothetical protein COB51_02815 [Moraxellaceae bacterium]